MRLSRSISLASLALALALAGGAAQADDYTINGSTATGKVTIESPADAGKLAGVTHIVGNLIIENYAGADLAPLHELNLIDGSLIISNTELTSLAGLGALEHVYGTVWIFSNPKLQSLGGLSRLRAAQDAFTITDNSALTGLLATGVTIGEPIKHIKGSLTIRGNRALPAATASAFAKQCTVGGKVEVAGNGS